MTQQNLVAKYACAAQSLHDIYALYAIQHRDQSQKRKNINNNMPYKHNKN